MSCKALVTSSALAGCGRECSGGGHDFRSGYGRAVVDFDQPKLLKNNDHTTPAILLLQAGANSVTLTYQGGLAIAGILLATGQALRAILSTTFTR